MLRTQKKPVRSLACALGFCATAVTGLTASLWSDTAEACSVAGISYSYSESGRPIIWKNRDDNDSFFQNLRYMEPENEDIGGHICLEEYYWLTDLWVCGAGANESGFAVVNASVYEDTLVHEILNVDVTLMRQALYECETVDCFEEMLLTWNAGRPGSTDVVSSNFVAMDAHGNVMMWEANTEGNNGDSFGGEVNTVPHDPNENGGFVNHTNFNSFQPENPGDIRRDRATDILQTLADEGMMNPLTIMQDVSKDVCHDRDGDEGFDDMTRFPTQDCISRYQTAAGVVIEGVAPGQDPRKTTLWANLGEPSVGLYLPTFPAAQSVPEELDVWVENLGSSMINLEIAFNKRLRLYDDPGAINGVLFNPLADTHMRKERLSEIQSLAFPIEEELYHRSRDLFAEFEGDPDALTRERLETFANEQTAWAFDQYADGVPSLIEVLFLGYDITQNTINWMQNQVIGNEDELYDQALEGAQLTWRYLGDQIPKELNAVYQVAMRMMMTQGINPDDHITQTGSVRDNSSSSSSSSGSVWGGGAASPALLAMLMLVSLMGLRRRSRLG